MAFRQFLILTPIVFIWFTSCQHQAHVQDSLRIPAMLDPRQAILDRGGDPSFKDVLALIKSAPSGKIVDGLRKIQAAYPEYMKNHTLMYHSESMQRTDTRYDLLDQKAPQTNDFLHPRVIVYGSNARTILTFNGHPKYPGYATIETIEFDENNQYQMREIVFRKEPGAKKVLNSYLPEDIDKNLSDQNELLEFCRCATTGLHAYAKRRPARLHKSDHEF